VARRILMLNWRDYWHPASGGAELITYRILRRLVDDFGWAAEWFSGAYAGAAPEEVRDGIRFVRAGSQATVHASAYARYRGRRDFDVIVDQTNTIPFFTPLYARVPVTLFIHQLAREVWLYEAPALLGRLGYLAEPLLLRPYRNVPVITVSDSTAASLRDVGLRGPITIVPECVDEPGDPDKPLKSEAGDIVVLGRVVPSKRIEESIEAAAELRRTGWRGTLHVLGGGDRRYRSHLETLAHERDANAVFHGRVSDRVRRDVLRTAALIWMTSVREGWGLAISEAGRNWTPAVVYDSPGLRDAVRHERTGLVVQPNHSELARATKTLLENPARLSAYAHEARTFSCELTWDATAREFERALNLAIDAHARGSAVLPADAIREEPK
jgi:glycosyltransferase involved in cell wall biosynthesis